MANNILITLFSLVAFICVTINAYEPSPLQDFCVADTSSHAVRVNGLVCMDPKLVNANHFFYSGLDKPGNTSNRFGFEPKPVTVHQVPGLNTLGVSMARIDYAPYGAMPPHTHPRATEIVSVLEGTMEVGFVTSHPEYKLISKVLKKGDVFVFPVGLIHFQRNVGFENAVTFSALNSQNPGLVLVPNTVFGSNPPISTEFLSKSFQIDNSVINYLQQIF